MLRGLVERARKRWALRRYVSVLGPRLVRDYGAAEQYSIGRVATAMTASRLTKRYAAHAYAMFASLEDFVEWLAKADLENADVVSPAVLDASPYRAVSPAATRATAPDEAALYAARRDRYHALRREAARANGGSEKFMPPPDEPPWTMHDSGVHPRA